MECLDWNVTLLCTVYIICEKVHIISRGYEKLGLQLSVGKLLLRFGLLCKKSQTVFCSRPSPLMVAR